MIKKYKSHLIVKLMFLAFINFMLLPSHARSNAADKGIGFTMGWESTFGNSVSYHWLPKKEWDIHGGMGYNKSGLKIGGGAAYQWYLTKSLGLRSGLALVYSGGTTGEVELEVKFYPENSTEKQDIEASKSYEISSALMANTMWGGFWAIGKFTHLILDMTYNLVLAGNDVELSKDLKYSKDVIANNKESFSKEFDEKARDKSEAGGLGFNLGIRFLW